MKPNHIVSRIIHVLLWLLILAVAAMPAVFMSSVYGYFPILLLLAVLLVSVGSMLYLRRQLTISGEQKDLRCQRGSHVDLGITLCNRSRLICLSAEVTLFISDLFGNTMTERQLSCAVSEKGSIDLGMGLDMRHVGVYEVGVKTLRIGDSLGLFHCEVPAEGRYSAVVTPRSVSFSDLAVVKEAFSDTSSDSSVTAVGGTDYTGVREYVPGDPMKQIHWKLSAHTRDYLTKLQDRSLQQEFVLLLDFAGPAGLDHEQLMDIYDCLIEVALSLLRTLTAQDALATLVYLNREGQVSQTGNWGEEYLPELIRDFSIIQSDPKEGFPDAAYMVSQSTRQRRQTANLIVVTSRFTDTLSEELLRAQSTGRGSAIYMIIPAEYTTRDIENLQAHTALLDGAEIPCTLIRVAAD